MPEEYDLSPSEYDPNIIRHEPSSKDFQPAFGDTDIIDAVSKHVEHHLGEFSVFHEILSHLVHLDVFMVNPTEEMPFYKLVTCGMSERRMTVPDEVADDPEFPQFAELTICLPPTWPGMETGDTSAFKDENVYWPIRWLKQLARLPHEYDTFLGYGHTVPNGDPPEPFASKTKLCCMLVGPSAVLPEAFQTLDLPDRRVHFFALWPLHKNETDLKLKKGADSLIELFDKHNITDLLNPARPSVIPKKRFWFF
jgi:hypothetical protein